jgi:DNA-binding LacI/PurR family transcriptional regulator
MEKSQRADKATRRRVQQREIAAAAGVSISTVSRVLNNVDNVTISHDVKERVRRAAIRLGYPVAQLEPPEQDEQSANKTDHLVIFINPITQNASRDPFGSDIMVGVEAECRQRSIHLSHVVLEPSMTSTAFVLEQIKDSDNDGFIFLGTDNRLLLEQVCSLHDTVVLINAEHEDLPIDTFLPDNERGARRAVEYLLQHGHRQILHATDLIRPTIRRRHDTYRAVLEAAAIPYDPDLVLNVGEVGLDTAYSSMKAFLARSHSDFTAVFAANDATAIGIVRAIQEAGLSVPQDISVIGFDDIAFAAFLQPPLTTMRIEREELGKLAVRRLLERKQEPGLTPIRVELRCRLIERQSVAMLSSTR